MTTQCDKRAFVLLVLAALKHDEISEERARELLKWDRDKIRDEQAKRVGKVTYATREEVWAEEGSVRLRMTERNGQLLVETLDTAGDGPDVVKATATISDWRTDRLMSVMRQVLVGYVERHQ